MKVKVIKAGLNSYWYADKIGQVFDAIPYESGGWSHKLVSDESWGSYFDKDDVEIINEERSMKKSDLKTGMRVTLRDGTTRMVMVGVQHGWCPREGTDAEDFLVNPVQGTWQWDRLSRYTEDMKCGTLNSTDWDIMIVEIPKHPFDIFYHNDGFEEIWQRVDKTPEQVELDKLMSQISELQKQAEKLQEVVNK